MSTDLETLTTTHRQQRADLDVKNAARQRSATKKTRKGVQAICDSLVHELLDRQAAELATLTGRTDDDATAVSSSSEPDSATAAVGSSIGGSSSNTTTTAISPPSPSPSPSPIPSASAPPSAPPKRPHRAKARLARRAQAQDAAAAHAAVEAAATPDLRVRERQAVAASVAACGRVEHAVRSDGHCLYAAFADQLAQMGVAVGRKVGGRAGQRDGGEGEEEVKEEEEEKKEEKKKEEVEDYRTVRRVAAEWMTAHRADVEPFLEEEFEPYVRKVRDTAEWGGQVELLALASAYGVRVHVVQEEGRVEEIGKGGGDGETTDGQEREVWLAYYRHQFGLGEHYDSLRKKP